MTPGWHDSDDECCGKWTADGEYFVFQSGGQIWALPRSGGTFSFPARAHRVDFQPALVVLTTPGARMAKKLFVVGQSYRGELTQYDAKSGQFSPFLGGISAEYVAFSRDGQWVAYVSYPEGTLWRSKLDGQQPATTDIPAHVPGAATLVARWEDRFCSSSLRSVLKSQPGFMKSPPRVEVHSR